jgi:predicted nucleic acid-binding Zn ribbon protein
VRSLQSLFSRVLRLARNDPETLVAALQGLWPHVVGEEIAANSRPVRLRRSTLIVEVTSDRWARELTRLQPLLVEKTNRYWEAGVIDRMEFQERPED